MDKVSPNQSIEIVDLKIPSIVGDKSTLIHALEKGYAGTFFAPEIKINSIIAQIREIPNDSSKKDFYTEVQKILGEIPDGEIKVLNELPTPILNQEQWSINKLTLDKKKGALIKIPQWKQVESNYWGRFWFRIQDELEQSKFIVLDLRDSSGKSDAMGIQIARLLNGGVFKHPITRQHHLRSPEALQLIQNYYQYHYPNNPNPYLNSLSETSFMLPTEFRDDPVGYNKKYGKKVPVFVLISENCSEACENAVQALQKNPYVHIVGRNSRGHMHFGNPGVVMLPYSQIFIYLPTSYNEFADGRFLEKIGITPELKIENTAKWEVSVSKMLRSVCNERPQLTDNDLLDLPEC